MNDSSVERIRVRPANPILTGPIFPTLLRLTLPNLAAMLAATLVAIAETIYVGLLGTVQLAAIALVFPLTMLMQMLSAGAMGGGVSSSISRALGANDEQRAESLAIHALVIGLTVGLAFSFLFFAGAGPVLWLLGGRGAVLEQALLYAGIALTGAVFTWALNTLASILRGTGNMRVPAVTLLVASALQIVLGGVMGLGFGPVPRLGLPGVAWGLVISQALGALLLLWFLGAGRARVGLSPRQTTLRRGMFSDILKVGAVSALQPLQTVLTVLIVTSLVARFGTDALAGFGIGARLEFLLVPIVFALGVASVPMVGMAIGAGDSRRARKVAWTSAAIAMTVLGAIGLVVTMVPDVWSGLFTTDPAVRDSANLYLRLAGPGFAFFGLGLSLYFASQGSGRVLFAVLASMVRLALVAICGPLLIWLEAPAWTLFALVGASLLAYGLSIALAVYRTPWGEGSVAR